MYLMRTRRSEANHLVSQYPNSIVTSLPRSIPNRLAYRDECNSLVALPSLASETETVHLPHVVRQTSRVLESSFAMLMRAFEFSQNLWWRFRFLAQFGWALAMLEYMRVKCIHVLVGRFVVRVCHRLRAVICVPKQFSLSVAL